MSIQVTEQGHAIAPPAIILIDPMPALKQQPAFVDPVLYDRRSE